MSNSTAIASARLRVKAMDSIDGESITAHPIDCALRTVLSALHAGINTNDWGPACDAYVMLQQVEEHVRKKAASHD